MPNKYHDDIPISGKQPANRNANHASTSNTGNKSYRNLVNNQGQNPKRPSSNASPNNPNIARPPAKNNDIYFSGSKPANNDENVYFKRQNSDETVYLPNQNRNAPAPPVRRPANPSSPHPARPANPTKQRPARPTYDNIMNHSGSDVGFSGHRTASPEPRYAPQDEPVQGKKEKVRKKGKIRRFFRNLIAIVLVLYIGISAYLYSVINDIDYDKDSHKANEYIDSSALASDPWIENILLIGVDQRADEASRSDSMILVSVDRKHKKIKLTSFLRDTYVTIPDNGNGRLNAACTYGGAQLVIDTIEYNFKVKIDHYVYVNFTMFSDIVNGIGGIDVNITESEAEYLRDTVKIPYIVSGKNHLNGGAALWFCRIRKLDDDFHRTQRQRQVISSIVSTAAKTNPLKLIATVKSVLPNIKTDMSPLKMTALLEGTGLIYMHYDIEQASVPFDGLWEDAIIDDQAVLSIDKTANINKLHQYIYESDN